MGQALNEMLSLQLYEFTELRFSEGETDSKQINARNVCVCVCVGGWGCHIAMNHSKATWEQKVCSVRHFISKRMVLESLVVLTPDQRSEVGKIMTCP